MFSATRKVAATTTVVLVSGLAVTLSPGTASAAESCSGVSAPANTRPLNQAPVLANDTAKALSGRPVAIKVLANDTDPDRDRLYVTSVSSPARGDVCVLPNGVIEYAPPISPTNFTETLTYGVTDGDRYRTARVTVAVEAVKPLRATLQRKLIVKKKTVRKRAIVAFTNTNKHWVAVFAGNPKGKGRVLLERALAPGATAKFRTKARRVVFVAAMTGAEDEMTLINVGMLNTRNGRQRIEMFTEEDQEFRSAPDMGSLASRVMPR